MGIEPTMDDLASLPRTLLVSANSSLHTGCAARMQGFLKPFIRLQFRLVVGQGIEP